tara:strand:+ start:520 stop:723 length:204 start_codon:yes stop_codon:yes gene_type:complete
MSVKYAKVNSASNLIEEIVTDNTPQSGYVFKEMKDDFEHGSTLIGLKFSSDPSETNGFPWESMFIEE